MKLAIALLTKDRVHQTEQSIKPLLQPDKFDLRWCDGSTTAEGRRFLYERDGAFLLHNDVHGGADAAIVYAMTEMLKHDYNYIGIVEQDVLLDENWFAPTMALFERGRQDGLEVGAVSARSYQDRVLVQRDGYGLMHNLGSGMVIWTRAAAEIILANYRTGFTTENREIFNTLSGVELAGYWAFRGGVHGITADWAFDAILARHGLASLALTPSAALMLEDIAPMGLQYADGKFDLLRNDAAFARFASKTKAIRESRVKMTHDSLYFDPDSGQTTIFAHQIPQIGGVFGGNWASKWCQGFGPFGYRAPLAPTTGEMPHVRVPVLGHVEFIVSGGPQGGQVSMHDSVSGHRLEPVLMPDDAAHGQTVSLVSPGSHYRDITLSMVHPGTCFHGIRVRSPQPRVAGVRFHWSSLPPVEGK